MDCCIDGNHDWGGDGSDGLGSNNGRSEDWNGSRKRSDDCGRSDYWDMSGNE